LTAETKYVGTEGVRALSIAATDGSQHVAVT